MRRAIEPFKRSLAQGRKYPLTEPTNKYRVNREDDELLRPVGEYLGRGHTSDYKERQGTSQETRPKIDDDDEDLLRPVGDYLEKRDIDEYLRAEAQKGTPEFLQPIDDYLERESNKDHVYKTKRDLRPARRQNDFADYDDLINRHQRQQEKEQLQAQIAALNAPVFRRHREPLQKPPTFLELRMRHDNAAKKPNSSRVRQGESGSYVEVRPDDDLILPCSLDVMKYGRNEDQRLKRRCDRETVRKINAFGPPSPPPPPFDEPLEEPEIDFYY